MNQKTRRVGVLGSGEVGETLANGFLKHGFEVMRGSREPQKLVDWKAGAGPKASVGDFGQTAAFSDLLVLAVKGSAADAVVKICGASALQGKTILDATNPIADEAPDNGVLRFFTDLKQSLMERLQLLAPQAHFVKAFSCVGSPFMVDPQFKGGPPTMFICGNDKGAKARASEVLQEFGWEVEDMGGVEGARAIEPLCILWCIPGLTQQRWTHAFKLLKG